MTDIVVEQVRQAQPDTPPIKRGSCSTWLNPDTGAQMLHVQFGDFLVPGGRSHGVFYRAPNGELFDIALPVAGLDSSDSTFEPDDRHFEATSNRRNSYRWLQTDHRIQQTLGLVDDDFADEWPSG